MTCLWCRIAALAGLASLVAGCDLGRHYIWRPGNNRTFCVESGDRISFRLPENAPEGLMWEGSCPDPDVEVTVDHDYDQESKADVCVRVHRGYDGPSDVTLRLLRNGQEVKGRTFTLFLWRRTGDAAFWKE